jgi:hypothetical protein
VATLIKIDAQPRAQGDPAPAPPGKLNLTLDVGRTLALLIVSMVLLGISAALYFAEDKSTPAAAFFALGEAVLVSGFGIVLGAREGAQEAASKLTA